MMLETDYGAAEGPEDIHVWGFGGERGGERGVGSAAVEAGASYAGSGEEMSDWLHGWILVVRGQ
jgi:hypothetical protein